MHNYCVNLAIRKKVICFNTSNINYTNKKKQTESYFIQNTVCFFYFCLISNTRSVQNLNFNDLQNLNDRAIQILLKELDQQQLAKALKGASTEVQDRIFRNMSKTAANMLKEDLQFIGPLSLSEVDEAKSFILKTLFDLEKNGKLKINSLKPSELIK